MHDPLYSNFKKRRFCSLDFLSVTDESNSDMMLNGTADVFMSAVSDSASSSLLPFNSFYDLFEEDDAVGNDTDEGNFSSLSDSWI